MFTSISRQQFWFSFPNLPLFFTFVTSSVAVSHRLVAILCTSRLGHRNCIRYLLTLNTHNLQERRESDGEINHIPTITNGITNTTHTSHSNLEKNVSVRNLVNELRETIKVNSRELCPPSKKHKVMTFGDSNTIGYVHKLESLLNTMNYTVLLNLVLLQMN